MAGMTEEEASALDEEITNADISLKPGTGGIFARQALRRGKISFEIHDPFYSEKNQAELRRRIADVEAGKNLTPHELLEVDDE